MSLSLNSLMIEQPSTEFREGYEHFAKSGASFNDNPYVKDSQQYENWQAGFGSAWNDFFTHCRSFVKIQNIINNSTIGAFGGK